MINEQVTIEELKKFLRHTILEKPVDYVDKREFALDLLIKLERGSYPVVSVGANQEQSAAPSVEQSN